MEDIIKKELKDGRTYSIRKDRRRYFFPDEWNKFISVVKNQKHKFLFLTLLNTGARIMESLHIKPEDFDFERGTIKINVIKHVVKHRKKKGDTEKFVGKGQSRNFFVASNYLKFARAYIIKNKIDQDKYIFLDNNKLPENYSDLNNIQKKKYYQSKAISYSSVLKKRLQIAGIEDWRNFSLHNLRKTYGNWMRIFDIKSDELCYRLGHDFKTFMSHYGSSLIFDSPERQKIMKIFGDVK